MTLLLTYTMDGTPPSLNNMYKNAARGRVLTDNAKAWKQRILLHILNIINTLDMDFSEHAKKPLRISIQFWVAELYRSDWDGHVKMVQDCTVAAMRLDDRYVVRASVSKRLDKTNPHFLVRVWRIDNDNGR